MGWSDSARFRSNVACRTEACRARIFRSADNLQFVKQISQRDVERSADHPSFHRLLPPPGGIAIRRVGWLVGLFVCSFVSSHPAAGCNGRWAVGGTVGVRQAGSVARA